MESKLVASRISLYGILEALMKELGKSLCEPAVFHLVVNTLFWVINNYILFLSDNPLYHSFITLTRSYYLLPRKLCGF